MKSSITKSILMILFSTLLAGAHSRTTSTFSEVAKHSLGATTHNMRSTIHSNSSSYRSKTIPDLSDLSSYSKCSQSCITKHRDDDTDCVAYTSAEYAYCVCRSYPEVLNETATCVAKECGSDDLDRTAHMYHGDCARGKLIMVFTVSQWLAQDLQSPNVR